MNLFPILLSFQSTILEENIIRLQIGIADIESIKMHKKINPKIRTVPRHQRPVYIYNLYIAIELKNKKTIFFQTNHKT